MRSLTLARANRWWPGRRLKILIFSVYEFKQCAIGLEVTVLYCICIL